jgi:hypothetical protein
MAFLLMVAMVPHLMQFHWHLLHKALDVAYSWEHLSRHRWIRLGIEENILLSVVVLTVVKKVSVYYEYTAKKMPAYHE